MAISRRKIMKHLLLIPVLLLSSTIAHAAVREYWIAADEVLWDYAPSFPVNLMTGEELTEDQRVFVEDFAGRTYLKALYQEYYPGFAERMSRQSEEQYLGTLGPIIRAEVGDTIVVHFRNNTRFPASVHPHGVFYDKASEGAPYADGTALKNDDAVLPGAECTYIWEVPDRAGPGPNDPSSIAWIYHSHTDETADTNAGLIGPMIITRKGHGRKDATPRDVDREFISLFTVYDENVSSLAPANLADFTAYLEDEEFEESNLMHGINGLVWGNNQGYNMNVGEHVRWYIIAMGTEVDLHTPHWHGVTLLHNGNRLDVAEVLPAATKTFDLTTDNPGTWMFHCHVNDHLEAGMMTTFTIQ
jgi:FtsP/CotA-like multicopper oxidase with cupredoxin domain